jgi:hypothetical protein
MERIRIVDRFVTWITLPIVRIEADGRSVVRLSAGVVRQAPDESTALRVRRILAVLLAGWMATLPIFLRLFEGVLGSLVVFAVVAFALVGSAHILTRNWIALEQQTRVRVRSDHLRTAQRGLVLAAGVAVGALLVSLAAVCWAQEGLSSPLGNGLLAAGIGVSLVCLVRLRQLARGK